MPMFINLGAAVSDTTRPIIQNDPLLYGAPGAEFLFDFLDPLCNANPDGALGAGVSFANLVAGGAPATIFGGAGISSLTGKSGLSLTSGNAANGVHLGATYNHDIDSHEFIRIAWFKIPATGFGTGYKEIFALTPTDSNQAQFWMDSGSNGVTLRAGVGYSAGGGAIVLTDPVPAGSVYQLAMHWRPGNIDLYLNGSFINTAASANDVTLHAPGAAVPTISGAFIGTIYRVYGEDATVSSLTAEGISARIAADYANNSGRV